MGARPVNTSVELGCPIRGYLGVPPPGVRGLKVSLDSTRIPDDSELCWLFKNDPPGGGISLVSYGFLAI